MTNSLLKKYKTYIGINSGLVLNNNIVINNDPLLKLIKRNI